MHQKSGFLGPLIRKEAYRRNRPRGAMALVAAALTVVLASCGSSFQRQDVVDSFSESYPEATDEQSACVADGLIDRFGIDELEQQLAAPDLEPEFEEAQFRELFACGMDGDVRVQLEEQLIDSGVGEENAPCVAEALSGDLTDDDLGVLLSGDITDEFYEKFFDAMDECGAINPDK